MALELNQTSALNILMEGVANRIALKVLSEPTDNAKAGLVRTGRLQDDPTNKKVNILIHPGGEKWPDILDTKDESAGLHGPATHTIGRGFGSQYWRRRVKVEITIFFINQTTRDAARIKSNLVVSRIMSALLTWDVGRETPKDSFGEHCYAVQIANTFIEEGGGAGDYTWRGEMIVELLTEIEPPEED